MTATLSRRFLLGTGLATVFAFIAEARSPKRRGRTSPGAVTYDATVSDLASLNAAISTAIGAGATWSGKRIGVMPGNYGSAAIDMTGLSAGILSNYLTFEAVPGPTPVWPGINLGSCKYVVIKNIKNTRTYVKNDTQPGVIFGVSPSYVKFLGGEVAPLPAMVNADFHFYMSITGNGNGLAFMEGEAVTTSAGGSGHWTGLAPRSTASYFALTDTAPGDAAAKWNGTTVTGTTSTATRVLGANVSGINENGIVKFASGIDISGAADNMIVQGVAIHDAYRPCSGTWTNSSIKNCDFNDIYQNFTNHGGNCANSEFWGNRGTGIWAQNTDGAPGTNGPHESIIGFSFGTTGVNTFRLIGNILAAGDNRYNYDGKVSITSGPEFNDQGSYCTVSISGSVATVTAKEASGVNIAVGMGIRYPGGPEGVTIASQVSGTTGQTGVYNLSSAAMAGASRTDFWITSINLNVDVMGNIFITRGSLGLEYAYMMNSRCLWNSIITDMPTGLAGSLPAFTPQINRHDEYPGCIVGFNIVNGHGLRLDSGAAPANVVSPDFYSNSVDSVCAIWNADPNTPAFLTTGPAAYPQLFAGKTGSGTVGDFSGVTAANALTIFAAKTGGRLDGTGYGHCAGYFDYNTLIASFPANPVPAASTVPTGVASSHVNFNGSTYSRWTGAGGSNMLGMTDSNKLTIAYEARVLDDLGGHTVFGGKNSAIVITRNAGTVAVRNTWRLKILVGGVTVLQADSSLTSTIADGMHTLAWIIDVANYKIWFMKAGVVDPFVGISAWNGTAIPLVGINTFTIGATYSSSDNATIDLGAVAIKDAYIAANTNAGLSKIIAQDGKPATWGSDGSTLFGSAAAAALSGNAAYWNAGTNSGAAGAFAVTGTITAAA